MSGFVIDLQHLLLLFYVVFLSRCTPLNDALRKFKKIICISVQSGIQIQAFASRAIEDERLVRKRSH